MLHDLKFFRTSFLSFSIFIAKTLNSLVQKAAHDFELWELFWALALRGTISLLQRIWTANSCLNFILGSFWDQLIVVCNIWRFSVWNNFGSRLFCRICRLRIGVFQILSSLRALLGRTYWASLTLSSSIIRVCLLLISVLVSFILVASSSLVLLRRSSIVAWALVLTAHGIRVVVLILGCFLSSWCLLLLWFFRVGVGGGRLACACTRLGGTIHFNSWSMLLGTAAWGLVICYCFC